MHNCTQYLCGNPRQVLAQRETETDEIFGNNEDLPDDDAELIFKTPFLELSQPTKLQALDDLGAKKGV